MAPKQNKPKMTLYHGELRDFQQCHIKVLKGVCESTKARGTYYVDIEVDGEHRYYHPENQTCLDFWADKQPDSEFEIIATGSREDALIELVGGVGVAPKPNPSSPARRVQSPTPHIHNPAQEPAARPTTQPAAKPSADVWKPDGQEVGMCMKGAFDQLMNSGIDPRTPEFSAALWEITSDALRVSRHLRNGHLAEPVKTRAAKAQGGAQ